MFAKMRKNYNEWTGKTLELIGEMQAWPINDSKLLVIEFPSLIHKEAF
ncbi:hypothetical protein LAV79_05910 [Peribacillus butanolivorans]